MFGEICCVFLWIATVSSSSSTTSTISEDVQWMQQLFTATGGIQSWTSHCATGWTAAGASFVCDGVTNRTSWPGDVSTCSDWVFCTGGYYSSWYGVYCDASHRVKVLQLVACGLHGTLPPAPVTGSSAIEYFGLSNHSHLSGGLPLAAYVAFMPHMKAFVMDAANVSGTLPNSISSWTNLTTLKVTQCPRFQGTLPAELGSLARLTELRISGTRLRGTIRGDAFAALLSLTVLDLSNNDLTGTLPQSLSHLQSLANLFVANNRFHGPFPSEWLSIATLKAKILLGHIVPAMSVAFNCLDLGTIPSLNITWWRTNTGNQLEPQFGNCSARTETREIDGEDWTVTHSVLTRRTSHSLSAVETNSRAGEGTTASCTSSIWRESPSLSLWEDAPSQSVSVSDFLGPPPSPSDFNPQSTAVDDTSSAAVAAVALCTFAAGVVALDAAALAALSMVPCSDVLRVSRSGGGSGSPLRYVLSPFIDLGPSMAALGNSAVILLVCLVQLSLASVAALRRCSARIDGILSDLGLRCVVESSLAMVRFPQLWLTSFAVLIPGALRGVVSGADVAVTRRSSGSSDSGLVWWGAAVAAVVVVLSTAVYVWLRSVGWIMKHVRFHAQSCPQWVRTARRLRLGRLPGHIPHIMLPTGEWTPSAARRRFGIVYGAVAGIRRCWIPGVLLLQSCVFVSLTALPVRAGDVLGCTVLHAVLAAMALVPLLVAVSVTPYRVWVLNVLTSVAALLVCVSAIVTAVGLQCVGWRDDATSLLDGLSVAQSLLMMGKSVLLLFLRVLEACFRRNSVIKPLKETSLTSHRVGIVESIAPSRRRAGVLWMMFCSLWRDAEGDKHASITSRLQTPCQRRVAINRTEMKHLRELIELICVSERRHSTVVLPRHRRDDLQQQHDEAQDGMCLTSYAALC